jgi:hypothetical protein
MRTASLLLLALAAAALTAAAAQLPSLEHAELSFGMDQPFDDAALQDRQAAVAASDSHSTGLSLAVHNKPAAAAGQLQGAAAVPNKAWSNNKHDTPTTTGTSSSSASTIQKGPNSMTGSKPKRALQQMPGQQRSGGQQQQQQQQLNTFLGSGAAPVFNGSWPHIASHPAGNFTPGQMPPHGNFTPGQMPPHGNFTPGQMPPPLNFTPGQMPPPRNFTPGQPGMMPPHGEFSGNGFGAAGVQRPGPGGFPGSQQPVGAAAGQWQAGSSMPKRSRRLL